MQIFEDSKRDHKYPNGNIVRQEAAESGILSKS